MSRNVRPTGFADWTDADLSSIAMQAKHAFERGRLKSCLAGTKILLQADPENQEARALQAAIRNVIQDDLRNAEELLANPRLGDQPEVFGAGAEIILRRILDLDPENEQAKLLTDRLNGKVVEPLPPRPQEQTQPQSQPQPQAQLPPMAQPQPSAQSQPPAQPQLPAQPQPQAQLESQAEPHLEDEPQIQALPQQTPFVLPQTEQSPFVAPMFPVEAPVVEKKKRTPILMACAAIALLAVTGLVAYERRPQQPQFEPIAEPQIDTQIANGVDSGATGFIPPSEPIAPPPVDRFVTQNMPFDRQAPREIPRVPTGPEALVTPAIPEKAIEPEPRRVLPAAIVRNVVNSTGTLAVSSRTAAEIYEGDQYLGSTPTSLKLSPGNHTLEYRHQDQRKVATHVITADETTTAMISFEVTVRINARPWANVFIQGAERRSLGQTPLSPVQVPIGGILVFENPNFPQKLYRVTGKETAIQVVFP